MIHRSDLKDEVSMTAGRGGVKFRDGNERPDKTLDRQSFD